MTNPEGNQACGGPAALMEWEREGGAHLEARIVRLSRITCGVEEEILRTHRQTANQSGGQRWP